MLYIDQAVAFGGSLVVLGNLIHALDNERFRPIVSSELDDLKKNHIIPGSTPLYVIRRIFNYVLWDRTTKIINRFPGKWLQKFLIYTLSVTRSLVNVIYIARIMLLMLRERVDIVHVNNGMNNLEPIIAAILLRCKYVVHFHEIETPGKFQRLLIRIVPKFITISDYLENGLVSNGIPANNLVVIPNPVLLKSVSSHIVENIRNRFGIGIGDKVFGIVGRIIRWKGHVEFLHAAKIILQKVPSSKAIVIGDYSDGNISYQQLISKMAEESGFKDRIIFTGYVKDVESFYSIMDVCLHTSIEPEPFGLVITEAMAYGVPVIASDRGAPKEIISNGENGFIVNPEDTLKLAEVTIRLLLDDKLRHEIGDKGKEHVLIEYDLKKYGHEIEGIYMDMLDG